MRNRLNTIYTLYFSISLCLSQLLFASSPRHETFGSIQTIVLQGSHHHMGIEYGKTFRRELNDALSIIKDYYITKNRLSYKKLQDQAERFYQRFPLNYQKFIIGMALGSELSLEDAKILNAMETLSELLTHHREAQNCTFLSIPANKTTTNALLIGRNYDFPPPFDQLSKYVTVTILQEKNTIPTAFISIVGEIYCPTCINSNGLFIEINNGMPSGGNTVQKHVESLLINLLRVLQNSATVEQMQNQLNALRSDFSLIINTANKTRVQSYEFSSTLGVKKVIPDEKEPFVSTNFYLNKTWTNIPKPTDASTWDGITRRKNMLTLAHQKTLFDIPRFKAIMNKTITEGGAVWSSTIYQIIVDMSDLNLYIKINREGKEWNKIPLARLFLKNTASDPIYSSRIMTTIG